MATNNGPMGTGGETVEADETYIGRKDGRSSVRQGHKNMVFAFVERGGKVRGVHWR